MHRTGWFGIALLAWVFVAESAAACDYGYDLLTVEETGTGVSPSAIEDVTYTVKRGTGPEQNGCEQSSTSCDDTGSIALHFAPASDEDSAFKAVGYRIRVVDGTTPESLQLPTEPIVAYREGDEARIWLYFTDGATDEQESIAFTIRITPVDADGNEGPESAPIAIRDGGSDGCGVARGGSGHGPSTALLVIALALGLRRRR